MHGLLHLNSFSYVVSDYLFDCVHALLHFRYTSKELCEGMVQYFRDCLQKHEIKAPASYQKELNKQ